MQDVSRTEASRPYQRDGRSMGPRPLGQSMLRGALLKCPSCGVGSMFRQYLKVSDNCGHCGESLHHHRADDAPAYFTIAIVGKVVVGLVLAVEMAYQPPMWLHAALWLPLTVIFALVMLAPIKGSLVGLQWSLLMHGFDPDAKEEIGDRLAPPSA